MNIDDEDVIIVRHKGGYNKVTVKCKDISNLRWDTVSGGQHIPTGTYDLYGTVTCTKAKGIDHSGIHGKCPHEIKVCILKKDNPKVYKILAKRAGEKPKESWRDGKNVSDEVRKIVRDNPGITAVEVANILEKRGIDKERTRNAIHRLKKGVYKNKEGLSSEKFGTTQKLTIKSPL